MPAVSPGPLRSAGARAQMREAAREAVEEQIDNGSRIEGEDLAEQQASDDGDSERAPQFRASPGAERQRNSAEQGRHRGHHNGPEAEQTGLVDGFLGRV